jgi:hypothetical protein
MGFFSFLVLLAIAYLVWRVTDQLPDLIFRLSEIQRDVAELRRRLAAEDTAAAPELSAEPAAAPAAAPSAEGSAEPTAAAEEEARS